LIIALITPMPTKALRQLLSASESSEGSAWPCGLARLAVREKMVMASSP
jgi:hypothetical protein